MTAGRQAPNQAAQCTAQAPACFFGVGVPKKTSRAPLSPPPSPRPHAADAADMRQTRGILIPNGHISYHIILSYHIDIYDMI